MSMGGHQSARALKDEWLTPPAIIEALGPFDLDPCAAVHQPWPSAARHLTVLEDGLSQPWRGRVWCNPPYGRATAQFLSRCAAHGNAIALIFARTETAMFFEHVWQRASALLFIEGRLYFHHVSGQRAKANAGAPSVLVAFDSANSDRLRQSGIRGAYVGTWEGTNRHQHQNLNKASSHA